MSRLYEPTADQIAAWSEWVESRPETVRKVAERFDPWSLYEMRDTGQMVTIASFFEDGTLRVNVLAEYNPIQPFDFDVFGVDPLNLVPAPPPGAEG